MRGRLAEDRVELGTLARALRDPRLLVAAAQQRIDEQCARLERAVHQRLAREREVERRLTARLAAAHPRERIARDRARAAELRARLVRVGTRLVEGETARVRHLTARLDAMSPLKVLARGYAIVTRDDSRGPAVRDAAEVTGGDTVHVRVAQGAFDAQVKAREK
jgi:exodeoxyribonuclease VII large subunit